MPKGHVGEPDSKCGWPMAGRAGACRVVWLLLGPLGQTCPSAETPSFPPVLLLGPGREHCSGGHSQSS
eukprot:4820763-Amphidinium_carterae.1